ncbi:MAG: hypothetical protein QOH41_1530 [Blastocatellia bacterium]|jgi:hypothetical protein|nr:hypothetical protein [Blastocatellia bacterium]
MKRNAKPLLGLVIVSALLAVLVPWNTPVVPAVRLQVFDETGKPAAGVRVEQEWIYEAIGSDFERATSATDANGYVSFPQRSVRISLARKALSFVRSLAPVMCADGFGPSGSIEAYGPDSRANDIVVCDVNNPNPRPLKLTRWDLVAH